LDQIGRNQPAIAFSRIEPYHRGGSGIFRRIALPVDRRIRKQQRAANASAAEVDEEIRPQRNF
jgi:hypothetical protein